MKDWYFYQERGRTVGPVGIEDLRARIKEGRIRLFDLVYRDGDSGWRMALENPDLRGEFKAVSLDTLKDRPWVILQKKTSVAMDFVTQGPFSEKEVRESILAGRISYSDYIWRDSFSQWRRIASLEEFNPRIAAQAQVPVTVEPPVARGELLSSVVEMKRHKVKLADEPPQEAKRIEAPEMLIEPPVPVLEPEPIPESLKARGRSAWLDWGIVAGLILLITGATFYFYHSATELLPTSPNLVQEVSMPEPASPPLPPPAAAEPEPEDEPEPKSVAKAESVPSTPPTELVLKVDVKGNSARFEVRSNGSAGYPVYIQIVGLPGQVSDGASFYRYLKLSPKAGQALDLSGVKLPLGKFVMRAESGDLRKDSRFSLGIGDPKYKAAVQRQRKLHAHAIWRERLELLQLAKRLEADLDGALNGNAFKAKGFTALNAVRRGNPAGHILFEDWFELKQILAEARKTPSVGLFERARKARERMASFSVWK